MENKDYIKLYNAEDKSILKIAEDSLNPKIDRVSEIIAYCHEAGIKKVGIANCIADQVPLWKFPEWKNDSQISYQF